LKDITRESGQHNETERCHIQANFVWFVEKIDIYHLFGLFLSRDRIGVEEWPPERPQAGFTLFRDLFYLAATLPSQRAG
jgi:hypothetical protein